jgi:hypothetical protein
LKRGWGDNRDCGRPRQQAFFLSEFPVLKT